MSVSVCLSLCVCVYICPRSCLRDSTSDLNHVTHGCGSVLLWRRSNKLCTSGFMDDVIFAHKPTLVDVAAQLKRSAHAALGLAITVRINTSCRPTDARDYFSGASVL